VGLSMAACGNRAADGVLPRTGPPRVQSATAIQRAQWFDSHDPDRPAGSQGELVASSYLLARLEQAGYVVSLDPVPVGNLLHSTNVIALAPSGAATTVVIVDYDTSASARSDGPALGTFLEMARALRVLQAHHSVEFAALGAQHTDVNGGQVGARSLIELLKQARPQPSIIRIGNIRQGASGLTVTGPRAASITAAAAKQGVAARRSGSVPDDVFTSAGFAETVVDGNLSAGPVLLAYLRAATHK
jgi:hypothetical protein